MKKIILSLTAMCLVVTSLPIETGAEVRVRTRADGEYETVTITPGGPPWNQGIWSGPRGRMSLRHGSTVLNPLGDRLGDLVPTLVESSLVPHHPWAVWSRFNGTDYDLVYSAWNYAWSHTAPVARTEMRGDDLNPSLAFDRNGRPFLTWWNRDTEDGHGTVYLSLFGENGWIEPLQISNDETGGRDPVITIGNGVIAIEYDSDDGRTRIRFTLRFDLDPSTITDDIDPQTMATSEESGMSAGPVDKF